MKFPFQKNAGTSLVEALIYIALFAVFSIFFIQVLGVMTQSFSQTKSNNYLLDSGYNALERISREVRGASSVDAGNSTLGTSLGVLALNTTDSGGAAKTVKFDVSGGVLRLTENGTVTGNLTGGTVTVSSLIFRKITTTVGTAVKIELTLRDNRVATRTENFYDTVILRGGY